MKLSELSYFKTNVIFIKIVLFDITANDVANTTVVTVLL